MTPPCAICGQQVAGENHVEVDVEFVPPAEPPRTFHFHPECFDRTQNWYRAT